MVEHAQWKYKYTKMLTIKIAHNSLVMEWNNQHCKHKGPSCDTILSQVNPVHILRGYFFNLHTHSLAVKPKDSTPLISKPTARHNPHPPLILTIYIPQIHLKVLLLYLHLAFPRAVFQEVHPPKS